jgi:hypothetical protein
MLADGSKVNFESVLFLGNQGNSTIYNPDSISLVNVTMLENDYGIHQDVSSYTMIQNSILDNAMANLIPNDEITIESRGGNIISDGSMTSFLMGYNGYEDLHKTDPMLDMDHVPLESSPCVDSGNPEGIAAMYDLAGNNRVQGVRIDIGAYESPFTTAVRDAVWNSGALNVFPNPAHRTLHFDLDTPWIGATPVLIYNSRGHLVYYINRQKTGQTQSFREDITALPCGEYVLVVQAGTERYASKIILVTP